MAYLLDTGVLLRLVDEQDADHALIKRIVGLLGNQGAELHIGTQNIAEFWNVATRPKANNGLQLSPATVLTLFQSAIETICSALPEREDTPNILKRLLVKHEVVGKQVHDARLVAVMLSWQVESILTLNPRNFRRFEAEGISVIEPAAIVE
jgi:predicted nucleic acid-binding protein